MIEVAGEYIRFDPELLDIDPVFRWRASSQAASQQQRAQQSLQLIQLLGGLQPQLQMQGKMVDFEYLVARLAKDAFGYIGFENVIKPMPPQMMAGMMAGGEGGGQPGAPGGGMPGEEPPGDDSMGARSAFPGEGQGGEMVPGEGEGFDEVRQNADQISALAGEFGGFV